MVTSGLTRHEPLPSFARSPPTSKGKGFMRHAMRHFVAEFIGIFALVFVGGGAIMSAKSGGIGLIEVAIAHGLILAIMVTATMRISGRSLTAIGCASNPLA